MDPITHAASGAVAMLACPNRPASRWAVPLAALAAASPDVDIFFVRSPLDFLLLHRGITHSLAALPVMGVILAALMYPLWRRGTSGRWTFERTVLAAMGLVLLHIWLDCVTTYGTMIFLPFSEYRVRLNGLFIVDIWLLIPMLLTILRGRDRPKVVLTTLLWIFLYPAACVGLSMHHRAAAEERLAAEAPRQVTVLPEVFAPLRWRVLYETDTPYPASPAPRQTARSVHQQGLNFFGTPVTVVHDYPAAAPSLLDRLSKDSRSCRAFFAFTVLPLQYVETNNNGKEYTFYDLRFATLVPFMQEILALRPNADFPFRLYVRTNPEGTPESVRMKFSDTGRDSGWHPPQPPHPPTIWEWLVGLH